MSIQWQEQTPDRHTNMEKSQQHDAERKNLTAVGSKTSGAFQVRSETEPPPRRTARDRRKRKATSYW